MGRVIVWSSAVSTWRCVVFGLAPALRSTDLALGEALKEGQDNSRRALMPSLLSYQTIVSVMAIVIAALMLRSAPVAEARRISSSLADLSVVRLDPPRGLDVAERQAFVAAMTERLSTGCWRIGDRRHGGAAMATEVSQSLHVTAAYFNVLRIRCWRGGSFVASDPVWRRGCGQRRRLRAASGRIARHSGRLCRATMTDSGQHFDRTAGRISCGQRAVIESVLCTCTGEHRRCTSAAGSSGARSNRREAAAVASRLPWPVAVEVVSGSDWVSPVIGPALFAAWITTALDAALLLGVVGFFSLLDNSVQQRTREIQIRPRAGRRHREDRRSPSWARGAPFDARAGDRQRRAGRLAAFIPRGVPAGINPGPARLCGSGGTAGRHRRRRAVRPTRRALRSSQSRRFGLISHGAVLA